MARRFELDSVLQWLRETRLSTETECMSVLQGKSLSRDLQQSSTTLIKSMLPSLSILSIIIRPDFFYKLIYGKKFRARVGGAGKKRKKSAENDQLTGHFQSFFFRAFFFFF